MKTSHLVWIASFAGLLALYLVGQRRHASELAELRGELGAQSARGAAPRAEAEPRRGTLRLAPGPTPAPPAAAPAPAADDAPKPPPLEPADVRDQLEVSFTKQRADPRSAEARNRAETKLAAILSETSKLQSLECRASMCRIETVHQGSESYQQFVRGAFMNPDTKLWNGGFFSTPLADAATGKLVIVSYLAHDGEELPPVGEQQ